MTHMSAFFKISLLQASTFMNERGTGLVFNRRGDTVDSIELQFSKTTLPAEYHRFTRASGVRGPDVRVMTFGYLDIQGEGYFFIPLDDINDGGRLAIYFCTRWSLPALISPSLN